MKRMPRFNLVSIGVPLFMFAALTLFVSFVASEAFGQSQDEGKIDDKAVRESTQQEAAPPRIDSSDSWDRDPEQWAAAVEEFEAISDGTVQIQPEEIAGYSRVLSWVREQPVEALRGRATGQALRKDFLHDPVSKRGKLYKIEIQVCRAMPYETSDPRLGSDHLYEIWGWTRESGAWLYVAVTPDLPPNFPTGETISESATLYGYFYKLQGYLEAGAAPRSKPLIAPLFLGKLEWTPKTEPAAGIDRIFWMGGISLCVLWFVYRASRVFRRSARPARKSLASDDREHPLPADEWLQSVRQSSPRPSGDETKGT